MNTLESQTPWGLVPAVAVPSEPQLMVVIDTEEEFDWSEPHNPNATATTAIQHVHVVQDVFDQHGVKPCYVIDYPVADAKRSADILAEIQQSGRCEIGAHLHPWVSPPQDEDVTATNSFPGNLPRTLERQKLELLTERIKLNLGVAPQAYKAGRYGIGPNSVDLLHELGYRIDLSLAPPFDYSDEQGPNFGRVTNHLYRSSKYDDFISIPCTGAYVGWLADQGPALYPRVVANRIAAGVLAKSRALQRIRLSPEGYTLSDMTELTRFLLKRGVTLFTLSFHSPSAAIGHTPYVQSQADLDAFVRTLHNYLTFFSEQLQGSFVSPNEVYRRYSARQTPSSEATP